MGHSQADKEASRHRVLDIASRRVREEGLDGPKVADTMREAGLTHGGFYKHFTSREDLVIQAAIAALAENGRTMSRATDTDDPYAGLLATYLGTGHRDDPGHGCALVTLGAEAGRDEALKDAYEKRVRAYIELVTGLLADGGDPAEVRTEAMFTVSALVGAVLLARGVRDPELSNELLTAVSTMLGSRHDPTADRTE